jgi:hypothetical protein
MAIFAFLVNKFFFNKTIVDCLEGSINENAFAGSRVSVSLKCNSDKYNLADYKVKFFYGFEDDKFIEKGLNLENANFTTKINTEYGKDKLNYYFELEKEDKNYRYPPIKTLKQDLILLDSEDNNDQSDELKTEDITHTEIKFEDVRISNELNFALQIPDKVAIKNITLNYKFNEAEEFQTINLKYDKEFRAVIENPAKVKRLDYYFEFDLGDEKIQYPSETQFTIQDPKFLAMKKALDEFSVGKNIDMYLSYDYLSGNTVKINEYEKINGLSTIKFFVLTEVYKQIGEGKIKKTDPVSRYGYSGTVESGIKDMMISSSNEATGALILKVGGTDNINSTLKEYLGEDIKSEITHTPAYAEGGDNIVVAEEQLLLLKKLYNDEILADYKEEILEIMLKCYDYFSVKPLIGESKIYMKTGYSPPNMYGLIGIVENPNNYNYAFALHIYGKNKQAIKLSYIQDVIKIMQEY